MATNFNTLITNMKEYKVVDNLQDVVFQVSFQRNGQRDVDGNRYYANYIGNVQCPVPSGDSFIPYSELTEEIVLGWINEIADIDLIDADINKKIDEQISPSVVTLPFPWISTPENI
jgi:hypothetical protein